MQPIFIFGNELYNVTFGKINSTKNITHKSFFNYIKTYIRKFSYLQFLCTKHFQAYANYVYIAQVNSSKAMEGVDRRMKALSIYILTCF